MQLNAIDIFKTYTLEVPATVVGQTNFTFPDIPFLRDKKCYGIEATANVLGPVTGKSNLFGIVAFTQAGFITLVDNLNDQFVQNMPLTELRNAWNLFPGVVNISFNSNGLTVFSERVILWNKCTIYFPITPIPSVDRTFVFTIYYK